MFSTDQNIETIGQLVEGLKRYIGLQKEKLVLDIVEKVVRLITVITLTFVLSLLLLLALIYISFAAAYALSDAIGLVGAFAVVAGFYLMVFVLLILFRKQWIERPVVKFLASLLFE
ncbi:MAG: phage holin family protein [Prevotella sp.]|nr:phage holin family protein [Prevotella sp.]